MRRVNKVNGCRMVAGMTGEACSSPGNDCHQHPKYSAACYSTQALGTWSARSRGSARIRDSVEITNGSVQGARPWST
jgi:hypothetical protein